MLHFISRLHSPIGDPDITRQRIQSKKNLWDHFLIILPDIRSAQYDTREILDQIIRDCIEHLHTCYSGPEIFTEVKTAAITFRIPNPGEETLSASFTQLYFQVMMNKLKAYAKKENPD